MVHSQTLLREDR